MYIKKIYDENIGPIEKVFLDFPFNEDGTPKPILFVGENGSGKSTLLSNIVDSFYSIAGKHFNNAMQQNENGEGKQYFKAINPTEIRVGADNMYSYIQYGGDKEAHYFFKSGKLSVSEFKEKTNITNGFNLSWKESGSYKEVQIKNDEIEGVFQNSVLCYFGPDRYERPIWMGKKYLEYDEFIHPSIHENWSKFLNNPISVKNVTELNLQWLLDVIADSRPDVEFVEDKLKISNVTTNNLLLLNQARKNIESIMSAILGTEVYFALNFRREGESRFKIIEKSTGRILAPTLNSLSTGQIALFNMFSTIVRYADRNDINNSITLNGITGIVVIDEVELHLHTKLQKEVLPKLIKLFPKVQFIITTHAPLFLLGMQEVFGEENYEIIEMPNGTKIDVERFSEFQRAYEYFKTTQTYQKDAEEAILKVIPSSKAVVITEGATDWKHMKTAYSVLKENESYAEIFNGLEFEFFEYEPANSKVEAEHKLEMGNVTLTSICENYAKLPQNTRYIFIADRDVDITNKKMGSATEQYKKWTKNIYSFIIPVPDSRKDTPNICIEHLYSDDEIKTEVLCDDGMSRRLYIGNEFDKHGHSMSLGRFCQRKDLCGPNRINIIEGSQGDKIYSFDAEDTKNYALSKMKFSEFVGEHPEKFNFDNFIEIFKIIKQIVEEEPQ